MKQTEFETEHELKSQASTTNETEKHRHHSIAITTIDYLKMYHPQYDGVNQLVSVKAPTDKNTGSFYV